MAYQVCTWHNYPSHFKCNTYLKINTGRNATCHRQYYCEGVLLTFSSEWLRQQVEMLQMGKRLSWEFMHFSSHTVLNNSKILSAKTLISQTPLSEQAQLQRTCFHLFSQLCMFKERRKKKKPQKKPHTPPTPHKILKSQKELCYHPGRQLCARKGLSHSPAMPGSTFVRLV